MIDSDTGTAVGSSSTTACDNGMVGDSSIAVIGGSSPANIEGSSTIGFGSMIDSHSTMVGKALVR
jgi:hypothetical protein